MTGGTPNLSEEVRAIPGAGFIAPWFKPSGNQQIPKSVYDGLSAKGQHAARYIARDDEWVDGSWTPDWDVAAVGTSRLRKQSTAA